MDVEIPTEELPLFMTTTEKYEPVAKCETQQQADEYFNLCVNHALRLFGGKMDDILNTERANILYFAGYFPEAVATRTRQLFHTSFEKLKGQATSGFYL